MYVYSGNSVICASRLHLICMTAEFEMLTNDPDVEAERGPGGTLIFLDGSQYCVVGPEFVSTEESDCYAFGATREQAMANYAMKGRNAIAKERTNSVMRPGTLVRDLDSKN